MKTVLLENRCTFCLIEKYSKITVQKDKVRTVEKELAYVNLPFKEDDVAIPIYRTLPSAIQQVYSEARIEITIWK